jgi:hypothetical protein
MAPPAYLHGIAAGMEGRFGHGLFAKSGVCNARSVAQKAIRTVPYRTVRTCPTGPGAGPGKIPGRESAGNIVRPAYAHRQAFVRGLATVREKRSAVLRVPSAAINAIEGSVVFNPAHAELQKIELLGAEEFVL